MQTVTVQPADQGPTTIPSGPLRVYVNGLRRRDIEVITWQSDTAPTFGEARLAVSEELSAVKQAQTEQSRRLPNAADRVLIKPPAEFGQCEFHGVVDGHEVLLAETADRLTAHVVHQLAEKLKHALLGRWYMDAGQIVSSDGEAVRFNAGSGMLATAEVYQVGSRCCRLFDPSGEGCRWTVADTLGYLLAMELPAGIEAPCLAELNQLAGEVDLGEYNASGTTLGAALVEASARGGLEVRAAREAVGLVIYRPGRDGRVGDVRLQPSGRDLQLSGSNLHSARITMGRRPSRPPIRVIGDHTRHEATLSLQGGWDPNDAAARWAEYLAGGSEDWTCLEDVYRKWVLNEHGGYDAAPFNLDRFDFATLDAEEFLVSKRRAFLQCVSTSERGVSRGVVVEVRLSAGGDWRRWSGRVWLDQTEASITLDGDELSGDFFQAAHDGTAQVRVTASVESDRRIEVYIDGDPDRPAELYDQSHRAARWTVHPSSIYFAGEGSSAVNVRDDSGRIEIFARRRSQRFARSTSATVTLGWVDTSFHVGDVIERIDGRRLELSSQPLAEPAVRSVKHEFGEKQLTRLTIEG